MPVANVKKFLKMVQKRDVPDKDHLKLEAECFDAENTPEAWHAYFVEKRQRLIEFLNTAINCNEPVDCSI